MEKTTNIQKTESSHPRGTYYPPEREAPYNEPWNRQERTSAIDGFQEPTDGTHPHQTSLYYPQGQGSKSTKRGPVISEETGSALLGGPISPRPNNMNG